MIKKLLLIALASGLGLGAVAEKPSYFLVNYYPGATWNEALTYEDQPGLKKHHEYIQELYLENLIVMGGPVTDGIQRNMLSIMLVRTGSLEEARSIVERDPGVQMHLIQAEVVPWTVNMTSMRYVQRRKPPAITGPEQSFSIKRVDPESRINIED